MSTNESDDWVDSPGGSGDNDDEAGNGDAENANADATQNEQQFPRRSVDKVERSAANPRRRTSSISSGLAAMSPEELRSSQPRQPTPPPPRRSSTFPNQIEHDPSHDRARSPKSSLPDYHDRTSPTQKRGPGIPRNPVADTWREEAYLKKEASGRKISSAEAGQMQDRWKCEYCGSWNERGDDTTPDPDDPRVGAAGPSGAPTGPIRIRYYRPPGVAYARCGYCNEKLPLNPSLYDPRELSEDGVKWHPKAKEARKVPIRAMARQRVFSRWREDERRERSESRRAKQRRKEEEEAQSPHGWTVRPGSEERAGEDGGESGGDESGENQGERGGAEDDNNEWEDDNE